MLICGQNTETTSGLIDRKHFFESVLRTGLTRITNKTNRRFDFFFRIKLKVILEQFTIARVKVDYHFRAIAYSGNSNTDSPYDDFR